MHAKPDLSKKALFGSIEIALLRAIAVVLLAGCSEAVSAPDAGSDASADASSRAPLCSRREDFVPPYGCNGDEALCARTFDAVSMLVTHNAFSTEDDRFTGPNQRFCMRRQLEDGVRGLMLDLHTWRDGRTYLCHGACELGRTPLADGLAQIRGYLDDDPGAVVTLILESYAEPDVVVAAFDEAGLSTYAVTHAAREPWPTLGAMIARGERLVVLTDDDRGGAPWLLPMWEHMVDTPYAASTPEELRCESSRGDPSSALMLVNHFLTRGFGTPALATMINGDPFLSERITSCAHALGRTPSFVAVDFYDIGDGLSLVRSLSAR